MTIKKPLETITEEADVYQLAEGKTIRLSEMRCKGYYSLFHQVKWEAQPTSVQSWPKHYPSFANKWNNLFKNISKMSADNKLSDECFFFFLQKSRFSRTHISGLLCRRGLLLRNDDMV